MQLYVARHTQTNYNVEGLINYDPKVDVHLTPLGIEEAKQLASRLSGVELDAIFISQLPRTRETASYLKQYDQTPIKVDPRLNEQVSGYEGRPLEEYFGARDTSADRLRIELNGGESLLDMDAKVRGFLSDLRTMNITSALIITHGCVVESINAALNGLPFTCNGAFQIDQGDCHLYNL